MKKINVHLSKEKLPGKTGPHQRKRFEHIKNCRKKSSLFKNKTT